MTVRMTAKLSSPSFIGKEQAIVSGSAVKTEKISTPTIPFLTDSESL
jgi:hypothetical protein